MKVEFRKSFEKDLGKIRDRDLLSRIKTVIEEVENVETLFVCYIARKSIDIFHS